MLLQYMLCFPITIHGILVQVEGDFLYPMAGEGLGLKIPGLRIVEVKAFGRPTELFLTWHFYVGWEITLRRIFDNYLPCEEALIDQGCTHAARYDWMRFLLPTSLL